MTYGIIVVGAIAAAIVRGLCDRADDPPAILLSPRNAALASELAGRFPSVTVAADNQAVLDGASVVILSIRTRTPCCRSCAFGRIRRSSASWPAYRSRGCGGSSRRRGM